MTFYLDEAEGHISQEYKDYYLNYGDNMTIQKLYTYFSKWIVMKYLKQNIFYFYSDIKHFINETNSCINMY